MIMDADLESETDSVYNDVESLEWDGIIVPNCPSLTVLENFYPSDMCEDFDDAFHFWEQAGREIGNHEYLQVLSMDDIYLTPPEFWESFFRGLANNRSICSLELIWCNGLWGNIFEILTPFMEHNKNLTKLNIAACDTIVRGRELHSLSSIFREVGRGSSLREINFSCIDMKDEIASELIYSLVHLPQLQVINLQKNKIAMMGCVSLSKLLSKPETKLERVHLGSNRVGDEEATVLAKSLRENTVTATLTLTNGDPIYSGRGNSISIRGWGVFSKLLRESNNTLQEICEPNYAEGVDFLIGRGEEHRIRDKQAAITEELKSLLKMNSMEDKQVLVHQKAILFRHIIDLKFKEPLTAQKMLPALLGWIDRTRVDDQLGTLFKLMRANPSLWVE